VRPANLPRPEFVPPNGHEKVLVLVKALPHTGKKHGETVCCAGVTADGQWRRQYPVPFRRLKEQFGRWDWIEYDWIKPGGEDRRVESRRVQEDTIRPFGKMPERERAGFLDRIIVPSTEVAASRGQSLALIRPTKSRFWWKQKTSKEIEQEKRAYEQAASQLSFLDTELAALTPCSYAFKFDYETEDGKVHKATCDDWETAATFYRFEKSLGAQGALEEMGRIFNERYPAKGMAFAMGTHSRYPDVWLLVGVLRLDRVAQTALPL
jgi:hypothetical protein